MARITAVEAVKAGYTSKPTLYRNMRSGTLTSYKNEKGTKVFDVADLVKLFGEPGSASAAKPASAPADVTASIENTYLKDENARLKAELATAREDARSSRNEVTEERRRIDSMVDAHQKLLEDMNEEGKKGFFRKLFS
jgi:hypothetical protein